MKNWKTTIAGIVAGAIALLTGCAGTKANVVTAHSSDNVDWALCVDVIGTNQLGILTLKGMLCADASIQLQQLQEQHLAVNPAETFGTVKALPIETVRK